MNFSLHLKLKCATVFKLLKVQGSRRRKVHEEQDKKSVNAMTGQICQCCKLWYSAHGLLHLLGA